MVEEHDGKIVVRDDLLPGGTKRRAIAVLFDDSREFVYAGPVYGYAQIALAHAAADAGKLATVFVAKRKDPHPRSLAAKAAGAMVVQIPFGRLSNVRKKAREYCEAARAKMLPFGLDVEPFVAELARQMAAALVVKPGSEVWCAAGSGTLSRALQRAFPTAQHHAVIVGTESGNHGSAVTHRVPETFDEDAREPPPFPSCSNYDAKVWQLFRTRPAGSVFWNVGA